MNKNSICFAGLSRQEEAEVVSLFKQANGQRGGRWLATPETEANVLVIDMDSMYGQMSLMKALGTGKTLVALTAGGRADTDYVLARPVTVAGLAELLARIEADAAGARTTSEAPASPAPASDEPAAATVAPEPAASADVAPATPIVASAPAAAPATPAPAAVEPAQVSAAMPRTTGQFAAMPARVRTLADLLRPDATPGPVRVKHGDAPEVVLDPSSQTWLGGASLKALMPYGALEIADADITPLAAADVAAAEARLGGRHPFSRLAWLLALAGGSGALMPGYNPNDRYKLLKWPQTEREFPKHFRVATVMMKGPAQLTEIAEAAGVGLDEVIDFVNASLAVGVAEADTTSPAPADPAKGGSGLLGRFRR